MLTMTATTLSAPGPWCSLKPPQNAVQPRHGRLPTGPELETTALRVLARLDDAAQQGALSHVYTAEASKRGEEQDAPAEAPSFLGDWAHLLIALLAAHGHTAQDAYLERAKSVSLQMVDRFFDESHGGFFDTASDPQAIGYLQLREKPLADNLAAALGLLQLHQATRNDDYRRVAEATLSAFVGTYREHGEFAASFGLAIDLWLSSPVEITIEGPPQDASTLAMLRGAARLPYPNLEIKPALSAGLAVPARALICLDTVCLPPVFDPSELANSVTEMVSAQTAPLEDIFQRFPGF